MFNQDIDRLAIIGGGTMGRGITQAAARRGLKVLLIEHDEETLQHAVDAIHDVLDREIAHWTMVASDKENILSNITFQIGYQGISEYPFALEAVSENFEAKRDIFQALGAGCPPETIFITNTSTLSITELASTTNRPDRFIGMHFLNPVSNVRLVEVVRGLNTSAETFRKAKSLAERLERTAIEVFESPGYVTTRVMMPLVNEAIQVLMEGIASAEDIDTAIKIGYELPHGPLTMADNIGLDLVLMWMDTLFRDLGDAKYRPCPLLRMLVRAGHLGVKTGQGFFIYDAEGIQVPGSGQAAAAYTRLLNENRLM